MEGEAGSWQARFTAPTTTFPQWSALAPDRLFVLSDETGSPQVWVTDLTTSRRDRLTDQPLGVESYAVLPSGDGIAWWRDDTGDERGAWTVTGLDGRARPLVRGDVAGWSTGLSLRPGVVALGMATDTTYAVHVAVGDAPPRTVHESSAPAGIGRVWEPAVAAGGLSADGRLLCLWHTEGGDYLHVAQRVVDVATGSVVGEQVDAGRTLVAAEWSPVVGDARLALVHERDGIDRPAVWDLQTGARRDYPLDLSGPVDVVGWWPDATALLLVEEHRGRSRLHRLDVASGRVELVHDPDGWVSAAAVRPDGSVWLREESATRAARTRPVDGASLLAAAVTAQPPPGRPHRSLDVPTPGGPMHVLVAVPEGPPPYPAVVLVHGGPEWAYPDQLDPWEQALLDHGYAVVKPNYRGSTASTVAWRTAIHGGNIGLPEVADVVAALDRVVSDGVVDPARVAVEGWSWGGYVALLAAGLHPSRFAAVVAGVPTCDLVMCHEDCSPPQQAYDRAVMGGDPEDLPERYEERSPVTYVDRVAAPVLMVAGEHDSACPIRQVRHYADRLRAHGGDVTLDVYDAGHHATDVDERLRQARLRLDFYARHLDG